MMVNLCYSPIVQFELPMNKRVISFIDTEKRQTASQTQLQANITNLNLSLHFHCENNKYPHAI